jgi:hypothetical protein
VWQREHGSARWERQVAAQTLGKRVLSEGALRTRDAGAQVGEARRERAKVASSSATGAQRYESIVPSSLR